MFIKYSFTHHIQFSLSNHQCSFQKEKSYLEILRNKKKKKKDSVVTHIHMSSSSDPFNHNNTGSYRQPPRTFARKAPQGPPSDLDPRMLSQQQQQFSPQPQPQFQQPQFQHQQHQRTTSTGSSGGSSSQQQQHQQQKKRQHLQQQSSSQPQPKVHIRTPSTSSSTSQQQQQFHIDPTTSSSAASSPPRQKSVVDGQKVVIHRSGRRNSALQFAVPVEDGNNNSNDNDSGSAAAFGIVPPPLHQQQQQAKRPSKKTSPQTSPQTSFIRKSNVNTPPLPAAIQERRAIDDQKHQQTQKKNINNNDVKSTTPAAMTGIKKKPTDLPPLAIPGGSSTSQQQRQQVEENNSNKNNNTNINNSYSTVNSNIKQFQTNMNLFSRQQQQQQKESPSLTPRGGLPGGVDDQNNIQEEKESARRKNPIFYFLRPFSHLISQSQEALQKYVPDELTHPVVQLRALLTLACSVSEGSTLLVTDELLNMEDELEEMMILGDHRQGRDDSDDNDDDYDRQQEAYYENEAEEDEEEHFDDDEENTNANYERKVPTTSSKKQETNANNNNSEVQDDERRALENFTAFDGTATGTRLENFASSSSGVNMFEDADNNRFNSTFSGGSGGSEADVLFGGVGGGSGSASATARRQNNSNNKNEFLSPLVNLHGANSDFAEKIHSASSQSPKDDDDEMNKKTRMTKKKKKKSNKNSAPTKNQNDDAAALSAAKRKKLFGTSSPFDDDHLVEAIQESIPKDVYPFFCSIDEDTKPEDVFEFMDRVYISKKLGVNVFHEEEKFRVIKMQQAEERRKVEIERAKLEKEVNNNINSNNNRYRSGYNQNDRRRRNHSSSNNNNNMMSTRNNTNNSVGKRVIHPSANIYGQNDDDSATNPDDDDQQQEAFITNNNKKKNENDKHQETSIKNTFFKKSPAVTCRVKIDYDKYFPGHESLLSRPNCGCPIMVFFSLGNDLSQKWWNTPQNSLPDGLLSVLEIISSRSNEKSRHVTEEEKEVFRDWFHRMQMKKPGSDDFEFFSHLMRASSVHLNHQKKRKSSSSSSKKSNNITTTLLLSSRLYMHLSLEQRSKFAFSFPLNRQFFTDEIRRNRKKQHHPDAVVLKENKLHYPVSRSSFASLSSSTFPSSSIAKPSSIIKSHRSGANHHSSSTSALGLAAMDGVFERFADDATGAGDSRFFFGENIEDLYMMKKKNENINCRGGEGGEIWNGNFQDVTSLVPDRFAKNAINQGKVWLPAELQKYVADAIAWMNVMSAYGFIGRDGIFEGTSNDNKNVNNNNFQKDVDGDEEQQKNQLLQMLLMDPFQNIGGGTSISKSSNGDEHFTLLNKLISESTSRSSLSSVLTFTRSWPKIKIVLSAYSLLFDQPIHSSFNRTEEEHEKIKERRRKRRSEEAKLNTSKRSVTMTSNNNNATSGGRNITSSSSVTSRRGSNHHHHLTNFRDGMGNPISVLEASDSFSPRDFMDDQHHPPASSNFHHQQGGAGYFDFSGDQHHQGGGPNNNNAFAPGTMMSMSDQNDQTDIMMKMNMMMLDSSESDFDDDEEEQQGSSCSSDMILPITIDTVFSILPFMMAHLVETEHVPLFSFAPDDPGSDSLSSSSTKNNTTSHPAIKRSSSNINDYYFSEEDHLMTTHFRNQKMFLDRQNYFSVPVRISRENLLTFRLKRQFANQVVKILEMQERRAKEG